MDKPRHALATWRYLGRRAFHARPEQRCLPPPDDHAARETWCEGYRRAWCDYYARFPSSELDHALLEFEIASALKDSHQASDEGERLSTSDRPQRYLH